MDKNQNEFLDELIVWLKKRKTQGQYGSDLARYADVIFQLLSEFKNDREMKL